MLLFTWLLQLVQEAEYRNWITKMKADKVWLIITQEQILHRPQLTEIPWWQYIQEVAVLTLAWTQAPRITIMAISTGDGSANVGMHSGHKNASTGLLFQWRHHKRRGVAYLTLSNLTLIQTHKINIILKKLNKKFHKCTVIMSQILYEPLDWDRPNYREYKSIKANNIIGLKKKLS